MCYSIRIYIITLPVIRGGSMAQLKILPNLNLNKYYQH